MYAICGGLSKAPKLLLPLISGVLTKVYRASSLCYPHRNKHSTLLIKSHSGCFAHQQAAKQHTGNAIVVQYITAMYYIV